ncbi:hypothetical protein HOA92_03240 [archaeon]|nr:hypothetical protein [archaeon]MBT6762028.1 hypothetical protein [archaeon]
MQTLRELWDYTQATIGQELSGPKHWTKSLYKNDNQQAQTRNGCINIGTIQPSGGTGRGTDSIALFTTSERVTSAYPGHAFQLESGVLYSPQAHMGTGSGSKKLPNNIDSIERLREHAKSVSRPWERLYVSITTKNITKGTKEDYPLVSVIDAPFYGPMIFGRNYFKGFNDMLGDIGFDQKESFEHNVAKLLEFYKSA